MICSRGPTKPTLNVLGHVLVDVGSIAHHLLLLSLRMNVLPVNKLVDDAVDDLGIIDCDGTLGIRELNEGQILDGSAHNLLREVETDLDELLLTDIEDRELFTGLSAGQDSGDQVVLEG